LVFLLPCARYVLLYAAVNVPRTDNGPWGGANLRLLRLTDPHHILLVIPRHSHKSPVYHRAVVHAPLFDIP